MHTILNSNGANLVNPTISKLTIDNIPILSLEQLNKNLIDKFNEEIGKLNGKVMQDHRGTISIRESTLTKLKNIVSNFTDATDTENIPLSLKSTIDNAIYINSQPNYATFIKIIRKNIINDNLDCIYKLSASNIINVINNDNKIVVYKPTEWSDNEVKYAIIGITTKLIGETNASIERHRDAIKVNDTEIARLERQIALFKSNEFIKEKITEPCLICFNDMNEFVVTECRHIFCKDCFKVLATGKNIISCPECRSNIEVCKINITNVDAVNNYDNKSGSNSGELTDNNTAVAAIETIEGSYLKLKKEWRNECINKYGSKMSALVEYLDQLLADNNNRIIIFSQYNLMLDLIGKTLDEYNIGHVYCRGNVNVINKNITRFKRDKNIRIIMLSCETCSSGNNLTEANHIIMIDVLNHEDPNTVKDIEKQAFGRAVRLGQKQPVTITRLITTGTIEEEHYNKTKYDILTFAE
jgi:hypothetical protein